MLIGTIHVGSQGPMTHMILVDYQSKIARPLLGSPSLFDVGKPYFQHR